MKKQNVPILLSISLITWASTLSPTLAREKPEFTTLLEAIYAQQVEQVSYEELRENLWAFYQQPIDLNQATREDLVLLCILTETQLDRFFEHLAKNGALVSIYELQAIPTFDPSTIYQLTPFVQVQETYPSHTSDLVSPGGISQQHNYWLGRYERTLETKQGYQFNEKTGMVPYAGSPDKLATRLRCRTPQGVGLGVAGRKYPGEAFVWDPTTTSYGFDVWSAYLLLENKRLFKTLIIGDYQIGYGQGLVVNAGFSMDKSSETIPIMRTRNMGIKPHTSLATYGLRGIASTLQWKYLELTTYYASTNLDGKVWQDEAGQAYVKSIQRDARHRTTTEIAKKGQVNEQVIGGTLVGRTQANHAELGINALYNYYAIPLHPHPKKPHPPNFSGQENFNLGLFYRYLWQNLHFFGEGAIATSGGKAMLGGLIASLSAKADVSLLFRHYDEDFYSPHGDAFRENASSNSNEEGIYMGLKLQPIKKLNLHAYYDYFRFPAPTPRIPEPSSGYDWLAKATYQLTKPTLLLLQRKTTNKPQKINQPIETAEAVATGKKSKYKAQLKHTMHSNMALSSEVQWSNYVLLARTTRGYALVQKATYKRRPWSITGQVAWFDTDYDNRLFVYEQDVLYSRPMPQPYYKKGMKYYAYLCYKPTPSWRLELKYTLTWYVEEESIGSGQEKIEGNTQNELKLQAIYKF